jgi:glycosyltransferase involved in cell wall biosynthesis
MNAVQTKPVIRVAHIITDLEVGGAEMMLFKLISRMESSRFRTEVMSLMRPGPIGADLTRAGLPVFTLDLARGSFKPGAVFRAARWLRRFRPHVVQTWMYHADLLGSVAVNLTVPRPALAWNIRHSNLDTRHIRSSTIAIARICARLSRVVPRRIVCCSHAGRREHILLGYTQAKMTVIPNGFDTTLFHPNSGAHVKICDELALPHSAVLIGLPAVFRPQKNHTGFAEAAGRVAARCRDAHFVLCGRGISDSNESLRAMFNHEGLHGRYHLLGIRNDMPSVLAALRVVVSSSSSGEGFPNVLGEAMACGIVCVVTDVGDSAQIIGSTGIVVQPDDVAALADGILRITELDPEQYRYLADSARRRACEHFGLDATVARYEALYSELAASQRYQ